MSKEKENEFNEFSIRVPNNLGEVIDLDAAKNKRSRNAQINLVLEKHYERELQNRAAANGAE